MPAGDAASAAAPAAAPAAAVPDSDRVQGMQAGGPFSLTDQNGQAVTEKSWPGKYKLVFFGFTRCTDTCPATLQKISSVMEAYDPTATKLQPLFITTDPAFDTQQIMATYIGAYNGNILGLTGTKDQIDAVEKEYKVYAADTPGGTPDHSAYVYLMSPDDRTLEIMDPKMAAADMISHIKAHIDTIATPQPPAAATPTAPVEVPASSAPATPASPSTATP